MAHHGRGMLTGVAVNQVLKITEPSPLPAPVVTRFGATAGPVGAGVGITGANSCFNDCFVSSSSETTITLDGQEIDPIWVSPIAILLGIPPGATSGPVLITTPGGSVTAGTFIVTP